MWCWRRMEKITWTDSVRNDEVLHKVKEERNIIHRVRRRKANWIRHILHRNCISKHIIEGKMERGTEVRVKHEIRCKQLLDDLKEMERYCELKESTRLKRGRGSITRESADLEFILIISSPCLDHISVSPPPSNFRTLVLKEKAIKIVMKSFYNLL
jgi:hypothetical protein